jgi:flagellar biosynthesis protein FlgN
VDLSLHREALVRLMDEEARTLAELDALLTREHQILTRNDQVDALEDACAARQICMGTLLRIQDERRSALRMMGLSPDPAGIDQALRVLDTNDQLRRRWVQCAEAARHCRELNDRNGALVNSRMKRVEGMLEVLTGGRSAGPRVYGPNGSVPVPHSGRLVAAEA